MGRNPIRRVTSNVILEMMRTTTVLFLFVAIFLVSASAQDAPLADSTKEGDAAEKLTWPLEPDEDVLKAFQEPKLAGKAKRPYKEEIRFIWKRTFDSSIAIRTFLDLDGPKLRIVRLDGKGGYEPGKIDFNKTVDLGKKDWDQLKKLTTEPNALAPLKGMTVFQKYSLYPADGSTWSLEVRDVKKYSHEIIPSPLSLIYLKKKEKQESFFDFVLPDGNDFVAVCQKLLELAKSAEPKLFEDADLY